MAPTTGSALGPFLVLCAAQSARLRNNENLVHLANSTEEFVPNHMYRQDCFKRRPVSLLLQSQRKKPGAGMDLKSIVPFETVLKDGFFSISCVKDAMYYYGDKFGKNKFDYNQGEISNTSIVRYDKIVPKMDQQKMSPAVCFTFCRSVKHMLFFGIVNGRHCYCTPFLKAMPSDDSECDSTCEGAPSQMCGSKEKSNVWEMHLCPHSPEKVTGAVGALVNMSLSLPDLAKNARSTAARFMQYYGQVLQDTWGQAGDPVASGLCQEMKVHAGRLLEAEKGSGELMSAIRKLREDVEGHELSSMDFDDVTKSEGFGKEAEYLTSAVHNKSKILGNALFEASPESEGGFGHFEAPYETVVGTKEQYYPIMYFVDKEFVEEPSTCGGELLHSQVSTMDGCATACDQVVHDCEGFSFMGNAYEQGFCFLLKNFKTAQFYTRCGGEEPLLKAHTRRKKCVDDVKCMVKFSKFEGTTLAPDASGKDGGCKKCLKEVVKADRCFKMPKGFSGCCGRKQGYVDLTFANADIDLAANNLGHWQRKEVHERRHGRKDHEQMQEDQQVYELPAEIRYTNVGMADGFELDMVLTTDTWAPANDKMKKNMKSRDSWITPSQEFGQFEVGHDQSVPIKFEFQYTKTKKTAELGAFDVTFFDLDGHPQYGFEELTAFGYTEIFKKQDPLYTVTETGGQVHVLATHHGTKKDNPKYHNTLTVNQSRRSIAFRFENTADFTVTFGVSGSGSTPWNRKFLYSFSSAMIPDPCSKAEGGDGEKPDVVQVEAPPGPKEPL